MLRVDPQKFAVQKLHQHVARYVAELFPTTNVDKVFVYVLLGSLHQ